jgi:putative nucleotidyltransferase with HDIG domain
MSQDEQAAAHKGKSVLFVDDEPKVLQALERMLRPLRHEWTMAFAASGREALETLERSSIDVLVTDMRMPGMNGVELMQQVLERHPHVIRIALSGHAEREVVVRAVRLAHQYLSKPCEADLLRERLSQAMRLRTLLQNPTLQSILSRVSALRSVPALIVQMTAEMQLPNPSVAKVADIVASDPGMTAKVLQLINSAYFGLRAHVSDPVRAVQLLGLETIKSLVLSAQVYSQFGTKQIADPGVLWQHSMRTAKIAREVARRIGLGERGVNDAFTAGLLHDVGKLILAEAMPNYGEVLDQAATEGVETATAERQAFGASHAEVGSYLFGLWGLPYGIVEAIAWHHRPSQSGMPDKCPLTALHAANSIDHAAHPAQVQSHVDDVYLESLGLADSYTEWKTHVLERMAA